MKLLIELVLVLLLLTFYIEADQHISVFLQKSYGRCNEKFCNLSIVCRPLNRTSKLVSTDIYFHSDVVLEAPIMLQIITYKKFRTVYRQYMINIRTEICNELSHVNHPLLKIGFTVPFEGNFMDPCPLKGHRYIKPQVSSNGHHVPLVPVGDWKIDFRLSKSINSSNEHILSWSDFYEIKPTGAIEF